MANSYHHLTFLFQILLNFISLGVAEIKNNVALINSAASKIRMIHVTRCVIDTPVDIDAIFTDTHLKRRQLRTLRADAVLAG